ncbi:MAG: carboxypeptidase-like regulatory domain-containing protein [Spirochaetes bacterium]|nr:carboxypeptidase-like regulatory domain-containing protein [Spirochaetota bacterium]
MRRLIWLILLLAISNIVCSGDVFHNYKKERDTMSIPYTPDTTPPHIVEVKALTSNTIKVIFDEQIDPATALNYANYYIQGINRVNVLSNPAPSMDGSNAVILNVSTGLEYGMHHGKQYTLLAQNIKDISGNILLNGISQFTGKGQIVASIWFYDKNNDLRQFSDDLDYIYFNSKNIEFIIKVNDDTNGYYSYSIDDLPYSSEIPCTDKLILSNLSDGVHTLQVIGKDSQGKLQDLNQPSSVSFIVDTTPPVATLSKLPESVTNNTEIAVVVGGLDVVMYRFRLNNEPWSNVISVNTPIIRKKLLGGNYRLEVKGIDSAGNEQNIATAYQWRVTSGNSIYFVSKPERYTRLRNVDVTLGGENIYFYKYSINNNIWSGYISIDQPIVLRNLQDGDYTIRVIGAVIPGDTPSETDEIEYTWTVDTKPPVCTLSNLPANFTNKQRVTMVVSSTDGEVVAYKYKLFRNGYLHEESGVCSVTQPLELSNLSEASYTLKVMGIDKAGNIQSESSATEYTWTIDLTPPQVSLYNLPARDSKINSIDIAVGPPDVVSYKYCLNTVTWSQEINRSINITRANLSDGIYTLSVIGKDLAGNWQSFQTPTQHIWEIDTTPPTAVLLNKPPEVTNLQSADFVIGGVGVVKYRYKYNGGEWSQEYDRIQYPNIVLDNLYEGSHTIQVIGCDKAGNWQIIPTQYTWSINVSLPTAILSGTPSYYSNVNNINITVGGAGIIAYRYKIDNQSWSAEIDVSNPIVISNLSEGYHIIKVIGKNSLNQWQSVEAATTFEWIIDTVPPVAQLTNTPQSPTNNQSIAIKVYGVGVYAYKYSLDDPDPRGSQEFLIDTDDTINIDNILGGQHTLYVIARDEAGNWQDYNHPTTYIWTIDTSTPTAMFDAATLPKNITNQTGINIKVMGSNIVKYKYKLDTLPWSGEIDVNDPIMRLGLAEGTHIVKVIGKNEAGTWQSESNATEYSWIIDITPPAPPEILLQNLPNNLTNETSINIIVNGTGITHYRYKLNEENWSDPILLGTNIVRSGLIENTYNLYVIAKDEAGNWTSESNAKTYSWRVDYTSPIAAITNRPDNPSNQNWAEFIIAGTGIVQYKYKIDNGLWSDWVDVNQHIILNNLPDGIHTISVCGRKSSNPPYFEQAEQDATTYTWEVDTVAPTAVLSNLPSNPTTNTSISITVGGLQVVAYRYRINNGAWIPVTSEIIKEFPIVLSGLTPGNYQIDVVARDLAGNWQIIPTSYVWTINPPPLVSPATVDIGEYSTSAALMFSWVRPYGTADVKIQIASDTNFSNVVFESVVGNVDSYTFVAQSTEIERYYARVAVNDQPGKPLNDPSWKPWGQASNGIAMVGSVSGVVKNAVGFAALSNVTIELRKMIDNSLIDTTTTDTNGGFTFTGVPIGSNKYKLVASLTGYYTATKNNITITLGVQLSAGTIYLVPTSASSGTITGTVIDANDASKLAGVTVEVYNWQNILVASTVTASGGTFTTTTLSPGVYSVLFKRTNYYDLLVDNIVVNGNRDIGRQAICAYLVEPMVRVIVLWGQNPQDLDLHVVGPTSQTVVEADTAYNNPQNRFHVGYIGYTNYKWQYNYNELTGAYERGDDKSSTTVPDRTGTKSTTALVQDVYPGNTITGSGYGPEAINLWRYGGVQYARGIFTYTVRNWSGTDWYAGGRDVIVRIYDSQGMVQQILMPQGATDPGNTTRDWKAVKINIQGNTRSKRIIYVPTQGVFFNAGVDRNKAGFDW